MQNISYARVFEVIGIASVVASLVFVGLELQQSSEIARAEAQRSYSQMAVEISLTTASNPDLANVVGALFSGELKVRDMTPEQNLVLINFTTAYLYSWESTFDGVRLGILPASDLDELNVGILNNDFTRARWSFLRGLISGDFADFLETKPWYNSQ